MIPGPGASAAQPCAERWRNADALVRKVNRGCCRTPALRAIAFNGDRKPRFTLVEGHQSIMALQIRRIKPNQAGKDRNRSGLTVAAPVATEGGQA